MEAETYMMVTCYGSRDLYDGDMLGDNERPKVAEYSEDF